MDEREQLKLNNQFWQKDETLWQQEIDDWEHATQRLVALVYLLEKTLPEHTSGLEKHKQRIEQHKQQLIQYECGLDEQCMTTCPSHIDLKEHKTMQKRMGQVHQDMSEAHQLFAKQYQQKMKRVRDLAERLLGELT